MIWSLIVIYLSVSWYAAMWTIPEDATRVDALDWFAAALTGLMWPLVAVLYAQQWVRGTR